MYRHFESSIRPLLDVTRFRRIVEVGSENGMHTFKLLPYVRSRSAHLDIIDPAPRLDMTLYRLRGESCSTLHPQPSLDVLPSLEAPDVVLLDGDHNWYTVIEELRARAAGREGRQRRKRLDAHHQERVLDRSADVERLEEEIEGEEAQQPRGCLPGSHLA